MNSRPTPMPQFNDIEALAAFVRHGTTARAAIALRLSQAAVSKRLASLEQSLGYKVLERRGRNAYPTPAALAILEELAPHLAAVRAILSRSPAATTQIIRFAMSESIALSWGSRWIATFRHLHPDITLDLHVHRAPVAIEKVASGVYDAALTPDWGATPKTLVASDIGREPMVLLDAAHSSQRHSSSPWRALTIEEHSATWGGLNRQINRACKELALDLQIVGRIESFAAVVQLAKVGLMDGLAPLGIATSLGFPASRIHDIFKGQVTRRITLVCNKSLSRNESLRKLVEFARRELAASL